MVLDLAATIEEISELPPPSFADGQRYSSHIDYIQQLANRALDRDHTAFYEQRSTVSAPDPAEIIPGNWRQALQAISMLTADMWPDGVNGFQAFVCAQAIAERARQTASSAPLMVNALGIPMPYSDAEQSNPN
jgi:hypothetical protein